MNKITLLIFCLLLLPACRKGDSETHFEEVTDFYTYNAKTGSFTQITDYKTQNNFAASLFADGTGFFSLSSFGGAQSLFYHPKLNGTRYPLITANVINPGYSSAHPQQKIVSDSGGSFVYYCADFYSGKDPILFPYSRDIYQVAVSTAAVRNLTNNVSELVGSVVLSDDGKNLLYDEFDTLTQISSVIILEIASGSRRCVLKSDSTYLVAPQFVHNSSNIVYLETRRLSITYDVKIISQTDSSISQKIAIASVILSGNFPKLAKNNAYPNRGMDFECELINLETAQHQSTVLTALDNEFFVSQSGNLAFISGGNSRPQLTVFNPLTATSPTANFSGTALAVHVCDVNSDGSIVLLLCRRRINSDTGIL